jgi:hypothetical protein
MLWQSGEFLWEQEASSAFKLRSFRERSLHPIWSGKEGEALAAAAFDAQGTRFPDTFKFSPEQGRGGGVLQHPVKLVQVSIPPFAQAKNNRIGFAETDHHIVIEGLGDKATVDLPATRELPLPSHGRHHFIVGNFGLARPLLLSFEVSSGALHCWVPHESRWEEFAPEGKKFVDGYMQPDLSWSMHAIDAVHSGTLFVPTDSGLARVEVNPLSLTYSVDYVSSLPCLAGIVEFQSDLFALVGDSKSAKVLQVSLAKDADQKVTVYDISGMLAGDVLRKLRLPFKAKREMYWLCDLGQIRIKLDVAGDFSVSLIKWPANVAPCFMLGGPYVNSDGRVWQQCIDMSSIDSDEHGYCFVELGKPHPERKPVGSYRLMGGSSCLAKEQRLFQQPPWDTPSGATGSIKRITVPLLESTADIKPMICFSAAFNGDPDAFFAEEGMLEVEYLFWGHLPGTRNHRCVFHFDRAATPWDVRVLVYDGHLFIYDPDSNSPIRGWKIDGTANS